MNPPAPPETSPRLPLVLYVMGTARSGSTILEILLGNGAAHANVGELAHIMADGFAGNQPCACGQPASSCLFWSDVRRRLAWSDADVQGLAPLTRAVDWHAGFLRTWLGLRPASVWKRYAESQAALFGAIAAASGASLVAESSLYAGRAIALRRALGSRLRVVCITRDPAGLIASFRKPHKDEQLPKSTWQVCAYAAVVLAMLRLACWRLGPDVRVIRFEDFQADPAAALAGIARWAGVDLSDSIQRVQGGRAFSPGHIVTGNRVRKQKEIVFRAADDGAVVGGLGARLAVSGLRLWRWALGFA